MSDIITVSGRDIRTITAEILVLTQQAQQSALASACQIGKRLIEAKELVGHGEWGDYLKNEVAYSQSTANNFMRLYRELGENPNSQALANLGPTQALRLLALPEAEREEFAQQHDVAQMSTRELEQAIKEKKTAQEMLAIAQDAANDLRQKLEDAKGELAAAKTKPKITAEEIAQYRAEGREQARADCAARIDAAQEKAAAAEDARMDMEKALVEAQNQIAQLKAAASQTDPDTAVFKAVFEGIWDSYLRLMDSLTGVASRNPEQGKLLRNCVAGLLKKMEARLDG